MLYFYPNKPMLIHPESDTVREKSLDPLWWAEIKKNGSRLCLKKSIEESKKQKSFRNFVFWNRHKQLLKYEPCRDLLDELESINLPDNTWIDAELLHQKTKHIKNLIYIFDIYILDGKQLNEPLEVRRKLLEDLFKDNYKHIELAKTYQENFVDVFKEVIKKEENEGLVLKCRKGEIVWNLRDCPEVWWQLKIRKPTKNYRF